MEIFGYAAAFSLSSTCSWRTSRLNIWPPLWGVIFLVKAVIPGFYGSCSSPNIQVFWTEHWTFWLTWWVDFGIRKSILTFFSCVLLSWFISPTVNGNDPIGRGDFGCGCGNQVVIADRSGPDEQQCDQAVVHGTSGQFLAICFRTFPALSDQQELKLCVIPPTVS